MDFKKIIDQENRTLEDNRIKYKIYFDHLLQIIDLLWSLKINNNDYLVFLLYLTSVKKHALLALLSYFRLQHVEAELNCRWLNESILLATYTSNFKCNEFFERNNDLTKSNNKIKEKAKQWIENSYLEFSGILKKYKDNINENFSHANLIAPAGFNFTTESSNFITSFFDKENEKFIKVSLISLSSLLAATLRFFYKIDSNHIIQFPSDFLRKIDYIDSKTNSLLDDAQRASLW